jgi:tungstate transport system permease protein
VANEIFEAFFKALELILTLDQEVIDITFLSLRVSLTAILIATIIGIPLGIFVGSNRFQGRRLILIITNTGMSFPPVVMGLLIFLLFMNAGPFTSLGISILLTETAMIIAQLFLAIPIIVGLSASAVSNIDPSIKETAITLGASKYLVIWTQIREIRIEIFAAIIAAFGGAISEIGAVQIVGGNIRHSTRTLTTAIGKDISAGRWEYALALGIILLLTAFIVNIIFTYLQHSKTPQLVKGD